MQERATSAEDQLRSAEDDISRLQRQLASTEASNAYLRHHQRSPSGSPARIETPDLDAAYQPAAQQPAEEYNLGSGQQYQQTVLYSPTSPAYHPTSAAYHWYDTSLWLPRHLCVRTRLLLSALGACGPSRLTLRMTRPSPSAPSTSSEPDFVAACTIDLTELFAVGSSEFPSCALE